MSEQVQAHILKRYTLIKKIGSGAYGHVWKVTDKRNGETFALKKIFDAFQHSTDAQRTFREITLLYELDHTNIVKLTQVIRAENDRDLYLVFEYMEADLHNAIGQKILKDAHNRFIIYQLVKGLKYLHSAEIIHRDLKPSNLLLNSDCTLKICDFGLARSMASDKFASDVVLTEQVATRWYRAPQVLLGSHSYNKSADIWSVGCILAEILIGKPIFPGNSTLNQIERIMTFTGKPNKHQIDSLDAQNAETMIEQAGQVKFRPLSEWFKAGTPNQAIDLVLKMLQFNPSKRLTAAEILKHSYLASFSNPKQQLESKRAIRPPISDNTKLGVKDYRSLIYEHIKKMYRGEEQFSFHENKKQRPLTATKNERGERNVSNNSRNEKKPSEVKYQSQISREEEQFLKKKNSLKELIRNKNKIVTCKPTFEAKNQSNSSHAFKKTAHEMKENRTIYSKFK